jgi:formylglycine-generating enzyme required for sulfatase activity
VAGGTFERSYDGVPGGGYTDPSFAATVSDFRLDTYEVTVGRFRSFVASYPQSLPSPGSGKNPSNASDRGWDDSFRRAMPPSQAELTASFRTGPYGCTDVLTWTSLPGENENRPINCITWFEAFAFCIGDGGRLATEAEWNYAAAGGDEQRAYPWSSPPSSREIDLTHALYNPDGSSAIAPVGSRSPKGNGKWGHADLAGSMWEWVVDGYSPAYADAIPCQDCASLSLEAPTRVYRGGAFTSPASWLLSSVRISNGPSLRSPDLGARCARVP